MALTTYRTLAQITTEARKRAAYEKCELLFTHALALGIDVRRIEFMSGTQHIEVDFSDSISTAQATHLGLELRP